MIASVDPVGDYTPTLGRKRSFFDELFGNIGTISQPGLPGGSRSSKRSSGARACRGAACIA